MSAGTFAEGRSAAYEHRKQERERMEAERLRKREEAAFTCGALGHIYRVYETDSLRPVPTCHCARCGDVIELMDALNDMFERMEKAIEKVEKATSGEIWP